MRKKLKIFFLIAALIIIVAAAAAVFGAKKAYNWFQSEKFETYLQTQIKEYGNIHLAFGERELRLLPVPQVVFKDVDIIVNDLQRISIPELQFTIAITSLFSDAPKVYSITLQGPEITLQLPDPFADSTEEFVFPDVSALLRENLQKVQTEVEIESIDINAGKVSISFDTPDLPLISLADIHLSSNMGRNLMSLNFSMSGSFFDSLAFDGKINFKHGSINGSGRFSNLQVADFLPAGLFVKESVVIEDCRLNARYNLDTGDSVKLDLAALDIVGRIADGVSQVDPVFNNSQLTLAVDGQTVKLSSLGMNGVYPGGRLTADISFDLSDMDVPRIEMELVGHALNVDEAGRFLAILDIDAEHLFTNVILGGTADDLRFYIACDDFDDIFRYRKFELDFTASDATIHIPTIKLLLEKVNGSGTLREGWLTLSGADGYWRDSFVTDAELKLDLNTENYDFTFASKLEFALDEVQDLLLLINPGFTNQLLDRLENLQGRIPGTLDIKYKDNREVITVISEKFDAKGTFKIGKLPVTIQGGQFTYADDARIEFSANGLNLGNSRAQNISYKQDMSPAAVKANNAQSTVSASMIDIALSQVLPLVTEITADNTPDFLSKWQFTSGELLLRNFRLRGLIDNADTWKIDADVAAKNVSAHNKNFSDEPFTSPNIKASIKTDGEVVTFNGIDAQLFFARDNEVNVQGRVQSHAGEIVLDLDITAPRIDFDLLLDLLPDADDSNTQDNGMGNITGKIDFIADTALLFERTWSPVKATVTITRDRGYLLNLDDVALCNIALKGQINILDGQINMRIEPWITDGQMAEVLPCLSKDLTYAEGDISVQGYVTAKGDLNRLSEIINGEFQIYSAQGHVRKMTLLANLLSIINVTEFYRGSLPNFNEAGFDYTNLLVKGKITNGNIVIEDTTIDSSFFTAVASGSVDLKTNQLSIDILVAPFKTVDRFISYIPIIGHILGNNLVALPFRALGPVDDPDIIPLPPDAVAGSLFGILERTITSPISIFDNALFDLFCDEPEEEKNPNKQPGVTPPDGIINDYNPSGQDEPAEVTEPTEVIRPAGPGGDPFEEASEDGFRTTFWGPGPE